MDLLFERESLEVLLLRGWFGKVSAWAVPARAPPAPSHIAGPTNWDSYGSNGAWLIRDAHPILLREPHPSLPDQQCLWEEPQQGEEWATEDVFLGPIIAASRPMGSAGPLCPGEVGTSTRWCLRRVMREGRRDCTGVAACLEEAQVHGSDGIVQLLNVLAFNEGEGCSPGDLSIPTKAERKLDAAFSIWHGHITANLFSWMFHQFNKLMLLWPGLWTSNAVLFLGYD